MSFLNSHNHKRVDRILADLLLIQKSAESNKADPEDIRLLLMPVFNELKQMGFANTVGSIWPWKPDEPQDAPADGKVGRFSGHVGVTAPPWASIMDMAQNAPLRDLTRAMAVYLDRIDEELHK